MKMLIFALAWITCSGYNILIPLPFIFRSSSNLFHALGSVLAENGHDVTIITPFDYSNNHPNVNIILLPAAMRAWDDLNFFEMRRYNNVSFTDPEQFVENTKIYLADPRVHDLWLRRNEFHAIITYFQNQESTFHFLIDFEGAFIQLCGSGVDMNCYSALGNHLSPGIVPVLFQSTGFNHQSFWSRVTNFLHAIPSYETMMAETIQKVQDLQREKYNGLRSFTYYMDQVDLTMTNTHFVSDYVVPLLPNQIEIGCLNCDGQSSIPQDIIDFMEGSGTHGVIYFSLGSMVKPEHISEQNLASILEALGNVPQRVIMKLNWQEGLPSNVISRKWLPQQDILAHPKTKLFISHCGLQSVQETRYHGVPMISLPISLDQLEHGQSAVDAGIAEMMVWEDITSQKMLDLMKLLIDNPKYKTRAKTISKLMKDQMHTPAYRANWWVEYTIRNHKNANIFYKGKEHHVLHYRGKDLAFYQYMMVDVVLFLVLIYLLVFGLVWLLVRYICETAKIWRKKIKRS